MEFKIDTRDTFSTIIPVFDRISAKLTGELRHKCDEMRQSGSTNFILDLQHCKETDPLAMQELVTLHEESYSLGHSMVFTGLNEKVMQELKKGQTDLLINIAPRMDEAIDIISMEILERDLLSEE